MNIEQAIKARHSVRDFTEKEIAPDLQKQIQDKIDECNKQGNLHMKLVCDEPEAFDSTLAHYGHFSNVRNYVVVAGAPADDLEQRCGYYGEHVLLLAQMLGLNACWVALTFKKRYVRKMLQDGDKLVCVIALGYGTTQGVSHKIKTFDQVAKVPDPAHVPAWFQKGISFALLAPTAVNQQKFMFELINPSSSAEKPQVKLTDLGGSYSKVDLGIVRYHFEIGAGTDHFTWA